MNNIDEYTIDYRDFGDKSLVKNSYKSKPKIYTTKQFQQQKYDENQTMKKNLMDDIQFLQPVSEKTHKQNKRVQPIVGKCLVGAFLLLTVVISTSMVCSILSQHVSYIASMDVFNLDLETLNTI